MVRLFALCLAVLAGCAGPTSPPAAQPTVPSNAAENAAAPATDDDVAVRVHDDHRLPPPPTEAEANEQREADGEAGEHQAGGHKPDAAGHGGGHAGANAGADTPVANSAHGGKPDHYAKRFADAKRWSKSFDNPKRNRWQKPRQVIGLMKIDKGMTVADIGAGTGYFVPYLSRAAGDGGTVLALDVEEDMVQFLTERAERNGLGNVTARVVATDDPSLAPASVDRILIVNTWHHIGGRVEYTKKLAAALRPGGTLTIVEYTIDSPRGPPPAHRLPERTVTDELKAGGLEPTVVKETLPRQFIVIARQP